MSPIIKNNKIYVFKDYFKLGAISFNSIGNSCEIVVKYWPTKEKSHCLTLPNTF